MSTPSSSSFLQFVHSPSTHWPPVSPIIHGIPSVRLSKPPNVSLRPKSTIWPTVLQPRWAGTSFNSLGKCLLTRRTVFTAETLCWATSRCVSEWPCFFRNWYQPLSELPEAGILAQLKSLDICVESISSDLGSEKGWRLNSVAEKSKVFCCVVATMMTLSSSQSTSSRKSITKTKNCTANFGGSWTNWRWRNLTSLARRFPRY